MTETHRVRDLAQMIAERTGAKVDYLPKPRNEADENDLYVKNDRFLALGLEPITLGAGLMEEVTDIARKYAHRCPTAATGARFPACRCGGRAAAPARPLVRSAKHWKAPKPHDLLRRPRRCDLPGGKPHALLPGR